MAEGKITTASINDVLTHRLVENNKAAMLEWILPEAPREMRREMARVEAEKRRIRANAARSVADALKQVEQTKPSAALLKLMEANQTGPNNAR